MATCPNCGVGLTFEDDTEEAPKAPGDGGGQTTRESRAGMPEELDSRKKLKTTLIKHKKEEEAPPVAAEDTAEKKKVVVVKKRVVVVAKKTTHPSSVLEPPQEAPASEAKVEALPGVP